MKNIYLILGFTLFFGTSIDQLAQNSDINLQKYWYYRWRLRNNFLVVGDGQGCSLPAQQRYYMNSPKLQWGDGTIQLGNYIGVLATEYYLLQESSGNTVQTRKELYYALLAFNRLDVAAELTLGLNCSSNTLNGFFRRDDVPSDFITQHPEINSGLVPTIGNVTEITSTYVNNQSGDIHSGEESHDQAIGILLGLRLIKEFVDGQAEYKGENDNEPAYVFQDGETKLLQEAINIADRIISWIAWNDNPQLPLTAIWEVREPCTGQLANGGFGGANSIQWAGALSQIGHDITGDIKYEVMALNPNNRCWWRSTALFMGGTLEAYQLGLLSSSTVKPWYSSINLTRRLAAIGGDIHYNILPNCISTQVLASALEVWIPGIGAFLTNITNLLFTITNYYPTNTETYLANHCTNNVAPFNSEWLPLYHAVLHDYTLSNNLWPTTYIDYINTAPCSGPYNLSSNNHAPAYDWTSTDLLDSPERRGAGYDPNTVGDFFAGEYAGLDYMLIFNLYTIYGKRNGYIFPPYQSYYIDTYLSQANLILPYTINTPPFGSFTFGDINTPAYINAFYDFTIFDSELNVTADLEIRAGHEIQISPEFQAHLGSYFHAYIDDFECDNSDNQYRVSEISNNSITYIDQDKKDVTTNDKVSSIRIYPNPSDGNFTIDVNSTRNLLSKFSILDISGKLISTVYININEGINTYKVQQELPAGIYFVQVDGFDQQLKIIITQ
jgi:hypothetical protein